MTTRERFMSVVVLVLLAVVGGAFLFHQLFLAPYEQRVAAINAAQEEIAIKKTQVLVAQAKLPRLDRYKELSLPADIDLARVEYEKFLSGLVRRSGLEGSVVPKAADSRSSPTLPGKKPIYTKMSFTVLAHGNLESLVKMLDEFYHSGLLHQIKSLSIQRPTVPSSPQKPTELDVNMTVEALSVSGGENRGYLLPNVDGRLVVLDCVAALRGGPTGLAAVLWAAGPTGPVGPHTLAELPRNYNALANKDVFFGPPAPKEDPNGEVEVSRFVYLTDITENRTRQEAFLFDRYNNRKTRLRNTPGFDSFKVTDGEGNALVKGKIVRFEARDLVFQVDGKYYRLHVGQSVQDAMARPIPDYKSPGEGPGK